MSASAALEQQKPPVPVLRPKPAAFHHRGQCPIMRKTGICMIRMKPIRIRNFFISIILLPAA